MNGKMGRIGNSWLGTVNHKTLKTDKIDAVDDRGGDFLRICGRPYIQDYLISMTNVCE